FSYLELRPVDYRGALDAIRGSLGEKASLNQFRLQVAKLISLFCDGHARLSIPHSEYMPRGYAPYVAGNDQSRIYLCDGEEFLDDKHPYVKAIDGRPIADWLEVASYVVVKESPQWRLRQSLRMLANVNYIREELALPRKEIITLELESLDRKNTREMEVKIARRPKREVEFPDGESRRIGEVGYIRLPQMTGSSRFLGQLDRWMDRFKDTRGMIIDVRGNPGGSKDILLTLMPYFLKPGAPMRIIEFSAYRKPMELPKPMPDGFNMSAMSAQPVTSSHWETDAQRRLIGDAIKDFQPTWPLPKGKFSDFYVLAFDSTMNPKAYYYDKPLLILQDSGSFSASDIFLGGFKGLPNTTLMGTTSGGGNGWMESYTLPNTELEVVLCQTAKFRPTGEPYDGLGVPPDVIMAATPQDHLGKSDTVLDAAVKRLSR
ncbi:MAG: S41 family peptidase, partial [Verrucomicrobiota bacterium]|nr:S41 family peptidase [Verrucomicrobiota bacterium]